MKIYKGKKFKIKKYDSIEKIYCCAYKDFSEKELKDNSIEINCLDSDGKEIIMDWKEMKLNYEKQCIWGFIDEENVINIWVKKGFKASFETLLYFFGHEIGHRIEFEKQNVKGYKNNANIHFKEERRADKFAELCILVYQFAKEVFDDL
ncbi:MAG: hypothetical protein BV456_00950 [Thermoplasmata archaeon M8B2D]|nr:MAG: hypothetical protein BV456_00950 [Thermoplasmata archaeon M8B2D]